MKYIVITNMYPKEENLYRNAFIHRRVLEYQRRGIELEIFVLNDKHTACHTYMFEGVSVKEGNVQHLIQYVQVYEPYKILIHFLDRHMMHALEQMEYKYPMVIWVHGVEALGWYRRLFNARVKGFWKYVLQNMRQMYHLRTFIQKTKKEDVKFVFVSQWMKRITEKDTLTRIDHYEIIPNVIDTDLFTPIAKHPELRKKILLIRPFESKKYANDIAVQAIVALSQRPFFHELTFTIYGKGILFEETVAPIRGFSNVHIHNYYLKQNEIAKQHKAHGVFLCPTRQDAQGVSMCEAMASGLVPITSNNTAIPEFVEHEVSGFLTTSAIDIANTIEKLYENEAQFAAMSEQAAMRMAVKCNPESIIAKELKLMER